MQTATIFNMQKFSLNDGPGIRTVVFFKGCALRCKWCANPESQSPAPQMEWNGSSCVGCGHCLSLLPAAGVRTIAEKSHRAGGGTCRRPMPGRCAHHHGKKVHGRRDSGVLPAGQAVLRGLGRRRHALRRRGDAVAGVRPGASRPSAPERHRHLHRDGSLRKARDLRRRVGAPRPPAHRHEALGPSAASGWYGRFDRAHPAP